MATERPVRPTRPAEARRQWTILGGCVVTAAIILGAWFPLGAIERQRSAISQASAQLSTLRADAGALRAEQATLDTPAAEIAAARQQYQLVQPGQRLYQVLPANGAAVTTNGGPAPYPSDPGLQPVVSPTGAAVVLSSPTKTSTPTEAHRAGGAPGFLNRVLSTLEFWR